MANKNTPMKDFYQPLISEIKEKNFYKNLEIARFFDENIKNILGKESKEKNNTALNLKNVISSLDKLSSNESFAKLIDFEKQSHYDKIGKYLCEAQKFNETAEEVREIRSKKWLSAAISVSTIALLAGVTFLTSVTIPAIPTGVVAVAGVIGFIVKNIHNSAEKIVKIKDETRIGKIAKTIVSSLPNTLNNAKIFLYGEDDFINQKNRNNLANINLNSLDRLIESSISTINIENLTRQVENYAKEIIKLNGILKNSKEEIEQMRIEDYFKNKYPNQIKDMNDFKTICLSVSSMNHLIETHTQVKNFDPESIKNANFILNEAERNIVDAIKKEDIEKLNILKGMYEKNGIDYTQQVIENKKPAVEGRKSL
jgi:hypothetical protein